MGVPSQSKIDSHWLLCVLLTLLCGTPQVLTESDLARSAGVTHILWTFQLCTGPRLLNTGHTVDHTCSVTGNTPLMGRIAQWSYRCVWWCYWSEGTHSSQLSYHICGNLAWPVSWLACS